MPTPAIKEYDESVRTKLEEYRRRHGDGDNLLPLGQVRQRTEIDTSLLSRYVAGKPVGDVRRMERILLDVIQADESLKVKPEEIFETSVTRQFRAHAKNIRAHRSIGLLHAPAGVGKTCAIRRFVAEFPVTISIVLNIRQRDPRGVEQAIMDQINTSRWVRNVSRWEFLRRHLDRSDRPIIVDNAHRLTSHGRCWVFDFHDATNTPFILVGNPEILEDIARDRGEDQQSTRIGICPELRFNRPEQLSRAVELTLIERLPQKGFSRLAASIRELSLQVARSKGHLRALNKQLDVALDLFEAEKGSLKECFKMAHEILIRDYALEE